MSDSTETDEDQVVITDETNDETSDNESKNCTVHTIQSNETEPTKIINNTEHKQKTTFIVMLSVIGTTIMPPQQEIYDYDDKTTKYIKISNYF